MFAGILLGGANKVIAIVMARPDVVAAGVMIS